MEQCRWNNEVEQCWWRSVVELWNSVGRTMEQCWWNGVVVKWNIINKTRMWNSEKVMVEQGHSVSGTVIVEKRKYVGITVLLEQ